jgi:ribosomal protein S18 acetylase RimI-like enzyme
MGSGIEDAALLERIRQATRTGRPAADENFIEALERQTNCGLRAQKRGPKPKAAAGEQLYFGVS